MKKTGEISFPGASGKEYTFKVFPYNTKFKSIGCVYIVTVRNPVEGGASYGHTALFVGQSAAMDQTWTSDHPQGDCFQKNGADFICVYDEDEEKARQAIVNDLTKKLQLKCAG